MSSRKAHMLSQMWETIIEDFKRRDLQAQFEYLANTITTGCSSLTLFGELLQEHEKKRTLSGIHDDIQNSNGETLLHLALKENPPNDLIISILLYTGVDPHILNHNGESFLDVLCSSQHISNEQKAAIFAEAVGFSDPWLIKAENKRFLPRIKENASSTDNYYTASLFDFTEPLNDESATATQQHLTSKKAFKEYSFILKIKKTSRLFIQKYIDYLTEQNGSSTLFNIFTQYETDPSFNFLDPQTKKNIVARLISNEFEFLPNPVQQKWDFFYKLYQLNFPLPQDILESIEAIPALLELSKHNDVNGLTTFLEEHPNVNINHIKFENEKTLLEIVYTQRHFLELKQGIQKPKSGVSQKTLDEIARAQTEHPLPKFKQIIEEPITDTQKGKALESKNPSATEPSPEDLQEKSDAFFQLVLKKSNIHVKLANNQTFLHLVMISEEKLFLMDIVHYLLLGADPNVLDKEGKSPIDYASKRGFYKPPHEKLFAPQHDPNKSPLENLFDNGIEYYLSDDKNTELLYNMLVEDKQSTSFIDEDDATLRTGIIETLKPLIKDFPIRQDTTGATLLHRTIRNGNDEKSIELINTEFKPNIIEIQTNGGDTPLHLAIVFQKHNLVKALLEKGANITIPNCFKTSPLNYACDVRYYNTNTLIEIVNQIDLSEENITTIFYAAYSQKDLQLIRALVTKYPKKIEEMRDFVAAHLNLYSTFNSGMIDIFMRHHLLKKEDFNYEVFFKMALANNDKNLISLLIDEALANECLNTILTNTLEKASWFPALSALAFKIILDNATTFDVSRQNNDGNTLLDQFINSMDDSQNMDSPHNTKCSSGADMLLKKGADLNKKNNSGFSPLHKAVEKLHAPLVKELLLCGADPLLDSSYPFTRFIPFYANTPLDYAVRLSREFILPENQDIYRPFKDLFDTQIPLGKNPGLTERFMRFFSGLFSSINYPKKHLHYLLNNEISLENMPDKLKKPYPGLLKALIQYTIDEKRPDVLRTIFSIDRYSDEQLSFLKKDKALSEKIIVSLDLESKDSRFAPNSTLDLLQRLRKLSPSTNEQTMKIEKSINARMTSVLLSTGVNKKSIEKKEDLITPKEGKSAFFETDILYFQMMKAVNDSNFSAVKELFYNNPSYNFNIKDRKGRTLLDIVYTRNRKYEMALEEKATSQEFKSAEEYNASKDIFMLLLDKLDINDRTQNNKTLLHIAIAQSAPIEDIFVLILRGINVELKDPQAKRASEYEREPNIVDETNWLRHWVLTHGLSAFFPEHIARLAKHIKIEKLNHLSSFSSLPAPNRLIVNQLIDELKPAEEKQHQPPTSSP